MLQKNNRIIALRKLLKDNELDAFFISSIPNIAYLTGYSGFSTLDRDAFVLITSTSQYIFTHGIYKEDVKQKIKHFTLVDMKRENPISQGVKTIIEKELIKKLAFEAFDLRVSEFDRLTKQIDKKILTPSTLVNTLRIKKSHEEICALIHACEIGDKAFSLITKELKAGMTETEVAAQLEFFIKREGADISFPTIVAFEENAAHPHHMPTTKKLEKNNIILIDFGVLANGYCSDMTRTTCFGKPTAEKQRVFETVQKSQQQAIAFIERKLAKNEILRARAVDEISRNYMIEKGYPSMPHSLGHGIGLEVHESPRLTPLSEELLEEGNIFSLEPGIYLPGNMGVRIEDLFAIENNTLIKLSNAPIFLA